MRIRTNVLYSSILTCSNYIFQIITYPYVSRILGVENIGICNFTISLVQNTLLLANLGISIIGIREIALCRNDKTQLNRSFSALFYLNTISTFIALLIYLGAIFFIPDLFPYRKLLYIGTLQIIFNLFLVEWLFSGLENFKYITYRNLLVRFLYVVSIFLFVREQEDYIIYFLLTIGIIVINGLINWKYRLNYAHLTIKGVSIKQYISSFLIMGFYKILTSMYTSFNVIYLGFAGGVTEVGYYTTASKFYTVILGFFTAFTGVMLPRMSSLVSQKEYTQIRRLSSMSFSLLYTFSIPLIFFCIVFAPQLIWLLSGNGFEGAIIPMRIIMPLVLLIGMEQIVIIQLLMPLKQDRSVFLNSLFGAITGIALNLLLVQHYYSIGSACVWVTSELVVFISALYFLNKKIKNIIPWRDLGTNFLYMLPLLFLYLLAQHKEYNTPIHLLGIIILTCGYIYLIECRFIKNKLFISLIKK